MKVLAREAAPGISSTRRKRSIPSAELHLSMQELEVPKRLHQLPTMDQSSWFRPILVREVKVTMTVEMGTREADNLRIRAMEDHFSGSTCYGGGGGGVMVDGAGPDTNQFKGQGFGGGGGGNGYNGYNGLQGLVLLEISPTQN